MANEITIVGNLTGDPEIRYTQAGVAVASFTVGSTPKVFDKQSGEWKDGDALFLRCTVWRDFAEHVAQSLAKGVRVVVTGVLKHRSYETKDGEKRTSYELDVSEVGPSLRWATATVARAQKVASQPVSGGGVSVSTSGAWDGSRGAWAGSDAGVPF